MIRSIAPPLDGNRWDQAVGIRPHSPSGPGAPRRCRSRTRDDAWAACLPPPAEMLQAPVCLKPCPRQLLPCCTYRIPDPSCRSGHPRTGAESPQSHTYPPSHAAADPGEGSRCRAGRWQPTWEGGSTPSAPRPLLSYQRRGKWSSPICYPPTLPVMARPRKRKAAVI